MSELRNWVRSRSFSRVVRRWMNGNQMLWKTLENNRPNLREFGFSHRIVNLKHARNASFLPVIRAQSSPGSYSHFLYQFFWHTNSWVFKVEAVVDKIIEEARTREIGDGKIFYKT
ncbi:hypothetical protein M0R45_026331 [Rubus argutus]|uniref:Uncharacterized protein n=1 Tax=Rubus argutus TaxID=59490 RepID=A0AAW1WWQ6_RUBAR